MDSPLDYLKKTGILIIDIVVYVVITGIIALSLMWIMNLVGLEVWDSVTSDDQGLTRPFHTALTQFLPLLVAAIASTYIHNKLFKRPDLSAGFSRSGLIMGIAKGWAGASALLAVGFLILMVLGFIEIDEVDWDVSLFVGFIILFFIQSGFEEVFGRSFLIPAIEQRFNPWTALIISSVIFSILHGMNPDVSVLSLINIFLAGILLGLLFIIYRQIWLPLGLHAGWNFMQGTFFGFEVSGFETYSLLASRETGPDLWTGGSFGFEGSLFCALLLAASSIYLIWKNPESFTKPDFYQTIDTQEVYAAEES